VFKANGYFTSRSKLAYGKSTCTVGPPAMASLIVKVTMTFRDNNCSCNVSLTQYILAVSFQDRPNVSSNLLHASRGRYVKGVVESMKVSTDVGSRDFCCVTESFTDVDLIDSKPTTRSREILDAKENDTLLGKKRHWS
jgi:hypothetical protein